jgi:hypothetical protein
MNLVRAVSTEGFGTLKYHRAIRKRLDQDRQFQLYFEQETTELPRFYVNLAREDLGPLWEWLPEGALHHDPNAYSKSEGSRTASDSLQQLPWSRRTSQPLRLATFSSAWISSATMSVSRLTLSDALALSDIRRRWAICDFLKTPNECMVVNISSVRHARD